MPSAEELDATDPLRAKRQQFHLPPGTIYLDGNSLGPMPLAARERAREVVEQQWAADLITSWNQHAWIDLPETVGEKIAPLLGAGPGQVICCDSISVNLFKLLAAALRLNPGRNRILSQQDNFPTDLYVSQGLSQLLGHENCELVTVAKNEIESALGEDIAVLLLTQVNFRSGYAHDIQRMTELAHAKGILVVWDLAHSAGVMPLELDRWNVDFAVGCGYKYLNGGPGAPAFLYAAKTHQGELHQPIAGWMGHQNPFAFDSEYQASGDIKQFLAGTPPILSMSVLDAALSVYSDIAIDDVREKSLGLADFFALRVAQAPELSSLKLASPLDHDQRGGQLAYEHDHAYAICQALIAEGVIADFRSPNILRFGFSPLYLSYQDIAVATARLGKILATEQFLQPEFNRKNKVT
ncbi:kynureninase [Microbulbifer flavimaris]|uniref:Kynureninase n=2 Tax=Microbulbiferaceae TaxID=1706373 RepID=A0ABX4HY81_9GAMM|nr:kynureninase [Microbulbifer sp. ZGT114]PCO04615.1 kynureninase [Microbulbifer flavimaris]